MKTRLNQYAPIVAAVLLGCLETPRTKAPEQAQRALATFQPRSAIGRRHALRRTRAAR